MITGRKTVAARGKPRAAFLYPPPAPGGTRASPSAPHNFTRPSHVEVRRAPRILSRMLSGLCAFCGNQTHFTARVGRALTQGANGTGNALRVEIAATCDACHRFNVATGESRVFRPNPVAAGSVLDAAAAAREGEAMNVESWSPPPMVPVDTAFVPEGVAGFYKEAHDALSISAYRAVLLLVRSVIEATAKDRGVLKGDLVKKINELFALGELRKGTKDMAHALRILGNDMAHGDIDAVPTQEDARDALKIARFVLDDVYVADAIRADMLQRRGQAKSSDASSESIALATGDEAPVLE